MASGFRDLESPREAECSVHDSDGDHLLSLRRRPRRRAHVDSDSPDQDDDNYSLPLRGRRRRRVISDSEFPETSRSSRNEKEQEPQAMALSEPSQVEKVASSSPEFTVQLLRCLGLSAAETLLAQSRGLHEALVRVKNAVLAAFPEKFCVVGGGGEDRSKGDHYSAEYYDPVKNEWRELPNMNASRCGPAVCSGRGMLYAFGGWVFAPHQRRSAEHLSSSLGRWNLLAKMPCWHAEVAPVALGDYIYVCGGSFGCGGKGGKGGKCAIRYSMLQNQWEQLPDLPCAMPCCTSVVWQNKVLVVPVVSQFCTADLREFRCFSFDPECMRWETTMKLRRPRQGAACVLLNGALYACGGSSPGDVIENDEDSAGAAFPVALCCVERYIFAEGKWETLTPMLEARYAAAAAVVGGHLYIAGGTNGTQRLRSAECFKPETNTWYRLPPMSCGRARPGTATIREVFDKQPVMEEHLFDCTYKQSKSRTKPIEYLFYDESRKRRLEMHELKTQILVRDKHGRLIESPWQFAPWSISGGDDFTLDIPQKSFPVTVSIIPEPSGFRDCGETASEDGDEDSETEDGVSDGVLCQCGRPAADELGGAECWDCFREH